MTKSNAPTDIIAKSNPTVSDGSNRYKKAGQRRSEGPKRSLLRKIRIKIGGKVADIFTW
jgi:hypothetical protein